jgi:hypothetical protein
MDIDLRRAAAAKRQREFRLRRRLRIVLPQYEIHENDLSALDAYVLRLLHLRIRGAARGDPTAARLALALSRLSRVTWRGGENG